ncbi:hypothetical protein IKP85_03025 [bacterium]|nr:hypothetical protein [bacterium]
MMNKISAKITSDIVRYSRKNSASGTYTRALYNSQLYSALTLVELARFPGWGVHDIGITSGLGTLALNSFKNLFKAYKALKPIKNRASAIYKNSNKI